MRKILFLALVFFAASFTFAYAAKQLGPEFSAERVTVTKTRSSSSTVHSKVYMDLQRKEMRVEIMPAGTIMILDFADSKGYMLNPRQKTYTEMLPTLFSQMIKSVLATGDVCQAYKEEFKSFGLESSCRSLGPDPVYGYNAVKYEIEATLMGQSVKELVWVDPETKVDFKLESSNTSVETENIREGPQPASLFKLPPDYKKQ